MSELTDKEIEEIASNFSLPYSTNSFARAVIEADRAQQWRPIETAPKKHGDLLLGWVRYEKRGEDDDGNPYAEDGGTVDFIEWQDGGEHGEGYFVAMAGPWGDASDWITHWMPLPTPPKD